MRKSVEDTRRMSEWLLAFEESERDQDILRDIEGVEWPRAANTPPVLRQRDGPLYSCFRRRGYKLWSSAAHTPLALRQ